MWKFDYADESDIAKTWRWYLRLPSFMRGIMGYEETDEAVFLQDLGNGLNFKGEVNGETVALVYAEPKTETICEGHLFCAKGVNKDLLTSLIMFAKEECLKRFDSIMLDIPTRHKGVANVATQAGFTYTGLNRYEHFHHGKLLESRIYVNG